MFLVLLFSCITSVSSQVPGWVPEPFNPPSLPLAVKSPYVNCWLPQGSESFRINNSWARNWDNLASDSSVSREIIIEWLNHNTIKKFFYID